MAYNDEGVKAKLSALNETQESIVTVAQWIMFHRRHADRTASLWLDRIKDSNASKRLNLIYLANEVVQQSKARKRDDFLIAFSPLIPEAVAIAFRGAHAEVRGRIKRVVEVWRQRNIFEEAIQSAAESRMKEIETTQSGGGKKLLGGSLFSGSTGPGPAAPAALKPLIPLQEAVTKAGMTLTELVTQAEKEVKEVGEQPATTAHVRVARYNKALKYLSQADSSFTTSIQARKALIDELEKLVETNLQAMKVLENTQSSFKKWAAELNALKQSDEDAIMRGASSDQEAAAAQQNGNGQESRDHDEVPRPQTEELTPPPVEDFTPVPSPEVKATIPAPGSNVDEGATESVSWNIAESSGGTGWNTPDPGADLMASLSRPFSMTDMAGEDHAGNSKKARVAVAATCDSTIPGLGDDVDNLIQSERGGA